MAYIVEYFLSILLQTTSIYCLQVTIICHTFSLTYVFITCSASFYDITSELVLHSMTHLNRLRIITHALIYIHVYLGWLLAIRRF